MFLMSVSLARPGRGVPHRIAQVCSVDPQQFSSELSVSTILRCSQRSVGEVLGAVTFVSSSMFLTYAASNPKLYASFVFVRVRSDDLHVSAQLSEVFFGGMVHATQQQVLNVECCCDSLRRVSTGMEKCWGQMRILARQHHGACTVAR